MFFFVNYCKDLDKNPKVLAKTADINNTRENIKGQGLWD